MLIYGVLQKFRGFRVFKLLFIFIFSGGGGALTTGSTVEVLTRMKGLGRLGLGVLGCRGFLGLQGLGLNKDFVL